MEKLEESLSKLYGEEFHPPPGLSQPQLEKLEATLKGLRIPESLARLYRWHDGLGSLEILPAHLFHSFQQAISDYRMRLELGGPEGWCPLWFPVFAFEADVIGVEIREERQDDSPVYQFLGEETELYLLENSLQAFLSTLDDHFRQGRIVLEEGFLNYTGDEPTPKGSYSLFPAEDWPKAWLSALKRGEHQAQGASHTVASGIEALETGSESSVRLVGKACQLTGIGDFILIRLEDATGEAKILCPQGIPGYGEIRIRDTFEMVVAINHAKPTAAQRVMGMSAPYRAERVIFLEAGE